jgi:hypothetical protein
MNEELLKILEILKEDFEMLQDGSWDMNYSDGTEIEASLENVEKAIKIVKTNKL